MKTPKVRMVEVPRVAEFDVLRVSKKLKELLVGCIGSTVQASGGAVIIYEIQELLGVHDTQTMVGAVGRVLPVGVEITDESLEVACTWLAGNRHLLKNKGMPSPFEFPLPYGKDWWLLRICGVTRKREERRFELEVKVLTGPWAGHRICPSFASGREVTFMEHLALQYKHARRAYPEELSGMGCWGLFSLVGDAVRLVDLRTLDSQRSANRKLHQDRQDSSKCVLKVKPGRLVSCVKCPAGRATCALAIRERGILSGDDDFVKRANEAIRSREGRCLAAAGTDECGAVGVQRQSDAVGCPSGPTCDGSDAGEDGGVAGEVLLRSGEA